MNMQLAKGKIIVEQIELISLELLLGTYHFHSLICIFIMYNFGAVPVVVFACVGFFSPSFTA